ncbi:MAG TPA: ABC transporter permease [Candidatus Dormibacteraeota bacterium]|jgi:ABC-type transport system involved in multi-copper enzyme maturation permease subunit|nr:ABC transporter permease [Candidatus Dormibacteraeota bacterium]
MRPILTFARLTLVEASRRRLLLALVLLTVVVCGFTGWGFSRITAPALSGGQQLSTVEVRTVASQLLILVAFLFSGVLALSSALTASPAISGDIESHLTTAMLARPVLRAQYVLGRWAGLAVLVIAYAAGSSALELAVVDITVGYLPPHPAQLVLFIAAEGLVLMSLALCLSTRLSGMTGGLIAIAAWFIAWLTGVLAAVGQVISNVALENLGLAVRLLMPVDALWRGAIYAMEPAAIVAAASQNRDLGANPFTVLTPVPPAMLVWSVVWVVAIVGLSLWSVQRRDL